MHPTADTTPLINLKGLGRRVMPGVMAPLQAPSFFRAASAPLRVAQLASYLRGACTAVFQRRCLVFRPSGAGGGNDALHHNNGMHPTADTALLILR